MADPKPSYGDYYREIYAKGMLAQERPEQPIDLTMALSGHTALEQLDRGALTLRQDSS